MSAPLAVTSDPTPRRQRAPFVLVFWGVLCALLLLLIARNLYLRHQRNALLQAATEGDISRLQTLLQQGVDPNSAEQSAPSGVKMHRSALLMAAREGHWEVVHLLLEAGADPNIHKIVCPIFCKSSRFEIEQTGFYRKSEAISYS